MNKTKVRVRFAPSPTGPLHIGGVRTALYNYLFARRNGGDFLLRIEDTDQARYVSGAEEYILDTLSWLGISPDESVLNPGTVGPYRQSERREIYAKHIKLLIANGSAYYAFDTTEEITAMRERETAAGIHSPKYDSSIRMYMRNSLTLSAEETQRLVEKDENVTVRMLIPSDEEVSFHDEIRGTVTFSTSELDDKVIMKADGLPTYHLANVVDDKLMCISHVIRGEEWLSSTAHHVLLYRSFGWQDAMPVFAHLPLILKPSGKGKLSKRDGAKFGFPVFPLLWQDHKEGETYTGFKEEGFLPGAVINFLAFLGWNPGTEQELFSLQELCEVFSLEHINKSGAQFDFDKAKWYNQQYILHTDNTVIYNLIQKDLGDIASQDFIEAVIEMMKPRVEKITEIKEKSTYFFKSPTQYNDKMIKKKYKLENHDHFAHIKEIIKRASYNSGAMLADEVKAYITSAELSFGAVLPVLRVFITGGMEGPDLFDMMHLLGSKESSERIASGLTYADQLKSNS